MIPAATSSALDAKPGRFSASNFALKTSATLMGQSFKDAVPAFFLLLPGQICMNVAEVFKAKLEAENRPGLASNALLVAAGITVGADLVVVPIWGIVGAALVTSVSQFAYVGLAWWFVHRVRPNRLSGASMALAT